MKPARVHDARGEARRFARALWVALAVTISVATALTVWGVRAQLSRGQTEAVRLRFAAEFATAQAWRVARVEALQARVRALAGRPRLHAALEDDALDLLYAVAHDELQELRRAMADGTGPVAIFHRFLDEQRREIPPGDGDQAGAMSPAAREKLTALARVRGASWGVAIEAGTASAAWELMAVPFFSTGDRRELGALVVGIALAEEAVAEEPAGRVIWSEGRLYAPRLTAAVAKDLARALQVGRGGTDALEVVTLAGEPWLLSRQLANPGSGFPSVWEVRLASLVPLERRLAAITWRIALAGVGLAAGGWLASGWLSGVFARWFGRVAQRLEGQRRRREWAEWQLERTAGERDRAARFAADASHQLKTPVAVLRAGLDELAAAGKYSPEQLADVEDLLYQTDRLGHIIDDLLLLAKLDAGLIAASDVGVDLTTLVERALDDASVYPGADTMRFTHDVPAGARGVGESGHLMLILQNLLENAVKYSPAGREVHVAVSPTPTDWAVQVQSTSVVPVPAEASERIFERFHRGEPASGVPGYGLGLNLARQLARLHGGEVRLVRSDPDATVFELRLRRG